MVPHLDASSLSSVDSRTHLNHVHRYLQDTGILKINLHFQDDNSEYLSGLILNLHRHHGHGLPITHSAHKGWFWDVRPSFSAFQAPNHRARSESMNEFPWHTDCSYECSPPRFFALQVLQNDQCGGGTFSILNVGRLLRYLRPSTRLALLKPDYRITVPPEFIKTDHDSIIGSVVAFNQQGQVPIVRFREDIIAPLTFDASAALQEFKDVLQGPEAQKEVLHLTSDLMPRGSVILMDNCRWLHGRNEVKDPNRHLRRVRWNPVPINVADEEGGL